MRNYKIGGHSSVGKSHQEKGIKCQDSFHFEESQGYVVAAIADGLSSSKHSDIASKLATKESVKYCINHLEENMSTSKILNVIEKAFDEALFEIKQVAGLSYSDFDTTLTLVVYENGNLYYGHVGDGAIIALNEEGRFDCVTETQNGEGIGKDRPVYPLAATSSWVFEKYPYRAKAIYLATDGVLKKMMPPLLEEQKSPISHRYLSYIYNHLDKTGKKEDAMDWMKQEVTNMLPTEVDCDDKTLVVVLSEFVSLKRQPSGYYNYPTDQMWEYLQSALDRKLYPYKYEREEEKEREDSVRKVHIETIMNNGRWQWGDNSSKRNMLKGRSIANLLVKFRENWIKETAKVLLLTLLILSLIYIAFQVFILFR